MNNTELSRLMTDSANDAVLVSQEQFAIELDFSPASIPQVDTIINKYLDTYNTVALEDKSIFTICNLYGAYIGETLRKVVGGNWIYDEENKNAPSVFLVIGDNTYAFAGICYQKLVNDSKVNIADYFNHALAAHTSPGSNNTTH